MASGTLDFTELADRFADMSATTAASAQRDGDRVESALSAVLGALARIRQETVPAAVLELAPRELCATRVFDRVMVSGIRGSTWLPQALYAADCDGRVTLEIDGVVEELEIPLASPLVEAEVVRRRLPALVRDAQHEPRTYRALVERTGTHDYVVAPVVVGTSVIALLHADSPSGTRPLRDVDRDLLRMFADGVGLIFERAKLAERVEEQRRQVAEACAAAMASLSSIDTGPPLQQVVSAVRVAPQRQLGVSGRELGHEPRESSRLSRLTAREREVLALLASGATNAQLADRLTVAESTVKSHVKHILHKLAAGNRAAAIACYLRETRVDERRAR
jgi:DNA-binding CsgD family transcriptional regulator/GAF domain-containing protein